MNKLFYASKKLTYLVVYKLCLTDKMAGFNVLMFTTQPNESL